MVEQLSKEVINKEQNRGYYLNGSKRMGKKARKAKKRGIGGQR